MTLRSEDSVKRNRACKWHNFTWVAVSGNRHHLSSKIYIEEAIRIRIVYIKYNKEKVYYSMYSR
jgi:hypothetical protein